MSRTVLLTSGNDKFSYGSDETIKVSDGLLRDFFAGQAIHCFTLTSENVAQLEQGVGSPQHDLVATFCYALADAMLKARERKAIK